MFDWTDMRFDRKIKICRFDLDLKRLDSDGRIMMCFDEQINFKFFAPKTISTFILTWNIEMSPQY